MTEISAALRTGHDDLVAVLDRLTPDQLTLASAAAGWTIAQVLGHLGADAEVMRTALERARSGQSHQGAEFNQAVRERWQRLTPSEQATEFRRSDDELVAMLAGDPALPVDLGLPHPVDLATVAGLRLTEFALHSWDVRIALDPCAAIDAPAVPHLLDAIAESFGFLARPPAAPIELAVHLTDPHRSFGATLAEEAELTATPQHPDATVRCSAEIWVRLVTGRHRAPDPLSLTGLAVDDLRRVFPGF